MSKTLNEELKYRLLQCYENLQADSVDIDNDEMAIIKHIVEEQCGIRHDGMKGDAAIIEDYCLQKTWETIDVAAVCPKWHAKIISEYNDYAQISTQVDRGLAYANVLLKQIKRSRPELETVASLVKHHAGRIKKHLEGKK